MLIYLVYFYSMHISHETFFKTIYRVLELETRLDVLYDNFTVPHIAEIGNVVGGFLHTPSLLLDLGLEPFFKGLVDRRDKLKFYLSPQIGNDTFALLL